MAIPENLLSDTGVTLCAPEAAGFDSQRLQRVGDIFRAEVRGGIIPGAAVLVIRDGRAPLFDVYGHTDSAGTRPMRHDGLFRIASMTKPITVVAALSLLEEGRLALLDPLSRYLPEFAKLEVGVEARTDDADRALRLEPAQRAVTIQDLMRHTAGFTYGPFGDSLVQRAYRQQQLMDGQQSNAEMAAKLAALPLAHQPGTTFEYGMSTDVLGRVIEVVCEMPLDRCFEERIFAPLGMVDTAFTLDPERLRRLAEPHPAPAGAPRPALPPFDPSRPPRWFSGGGGLFSTASDYARFALMLLNGGEYRGTRILSRSSVALMTSNHLPPEVRYGPATADLGIAAPLGALGQGYGLGVGVRLERGRSPVPGSVGDFYWGGAAGTYFWIDPAERLIGILMLQESNAARRTRYRAQLRSLVYQALI
jgi:CubicO group peptidase (beta-lactamase class C family)